MFCMQCCNDLADCTCEDLQERLAGLDKVLVYRMCNKCKMHYAKCKCTEPEWITNQQRHLVLSTNLAKDIRLKNSKGEKKDDNS